MGFDFDNLDLFCRINVQSDMPFKEFVNFVARCAAGSGDMNEVVSGTLDISVHKNDLFDSNKSQSGKNRWLYFRYTLEVDPIEGVAPPDYIAAIGDLLQVFWSEEADAVAACEFEEQLPYNRRRAHWDSSDGSAISHQQAAENGRGGLDESPATQELRTRADS